VSFVLFVGTVLAAAPTLMRLAKIEICTELAPGSGPSAVPNGILLLCARSLWLAWARRRLPFSHLRAFGMLWIGRLDSSWALLRNIFRFPNAASAWRLVRPWTNLLLRVADIARSVAGEKRLEVQKRTEPRLQSVIWKFRREAAIHPCQQSLPQSSHKVPPDANPSRPLVNSVLLGTIFFLAFVPFCLCSVTRSPRSCPVFLVLRFPLFSGLLPATRRRLFFHLPPAPPLVIRLARGRPVGEVSSVLIRSFWNTARSPLCKTKPQSKSKTPGPHFTS